MVAAAAAAALAEFLCLGGGVGLTCLTSAGSSGSSLKRKNKMPNEESQQTQRT